MPALAKLTLLSTVARRALGCIEAEALACRRVVPAAVRDSIADRGAAERELARALGELARSPEAVNGVDQAVRDALFEELRQVRGEMLALRAERRRAAGRLRRLAVANGRPCATELNEIRSGTDG